MPYGLCYASAEARSLSELLQLAPATKSHRSGTKSEAVSIGSRRMSIEQWGLDGLCVCRTTLEAARQAHPRNDCRAGVRRLMRALSHQRGETVDYGRPRAASAMPQQRADINTGSQADAPPKGAQQKLQVNPDISHEKKPQQRKLHYRRPAPRGTNLHHEALQSTSSCLGPTSATALWKTSLVNDTAQNSPHTVPADRKCCPQRPGDDGAIG